MVQKRLSSSFLEIMILNQRGEREIERMREGHRDGERETVTENQRY